MCLTATVISTALGAFGAYQQYQAAGDAEDLAKENAKLGLGEDMESLRRERAANAATEADARARAAASGVTLGGSQGRFLNEKSRQNTLQENWMQKAAGSRYDIAKEEGASLKSQGYAKAASSLSSIVPGVTDIWGAIK